MSIDLKTEIDGSVVGFETGPKGVDPKRPTVILIHGSGGFRKSWRFQLQDLDREINVIALELPGHGKTPGPLVGEISDLTRWVGRVLEAWNLPKPFIGGHSLGGAIAIEIGLTLPELVGGLILVGTGARLEVNPALIDGFANNFKETVGLTMKWAFNKSAPKALIEDGIRALLMAGPEVLLNDFSACSRFDRRAEVHKIKAPTLVVCGRQDKMTPLLLSEYLRDNISGARLEVIDQAGHQVLEEQPESFNRAVLDFVTGLK